MKTGERAIYEQKIIWCFLDDFPQQLLLATLWSSEAIKNLGVVEENTALRLKNK